MIIKSINYLLFRIKGPGYIIDEKLPFVYLLRIALKRVIMMIRGQLSFIEKHGVFFLGTQVKIYCRAKIKLGKNNTIDDFSFIDANSSNGIVFGDNVSVGKSTIIECSGSLRHVGIGLNVGNNVGLGRDCFYGCAGGIRIGDDTIIGNYVSFHSENHNYKDLNSPIRTQGVSHKGIVIGKDCWLGAKVTVLDGVQLGDGCVVAAGAVLKAGIYQPYVVYGGVPAKILKTR